MKRLFYGILLILLCIALPLSADAQRRKPTAGQSGAQLTFLDKTSHDFGVVERRGGDLIKVFRFVNDGHKPLVIKRVTKSCSCITAHFPRKPIKPGEVDEIRVRYEPHKAEAGAFHKVVQIYTNTAQGEHLIMIQGNSVVKRRQKQ